MACRVYKTKKITTYDNYKMNLENHILPALGHMKLSKIRPIHIQRFCNELCGEWTY
ncbi:MAG: N-terminal phage integrase SAM-like domain-containing protein [Coprococcus sp.]